MRTENTIYWIVGGLAGLVASSASHVAGQSWVELDTAGPPIALLNTPVLNAGSCYEIQTDALSAGGDTIMSVRTGRP